MDNTEEYDHKMRRYFMDAMSTINNSLSFTILEIGAVPVEEGDSEPFHDLLDYFPNSNIYAFELDQKTCDTLNKNAKKGLHYIPSAIGRKEESRTLYETEASYCYSLYKPDVELLSRYNNMHYKNIESVTSINTVSLDYFAKNNNINEVDFIKIDVEAAELDIFKGGINTLKNVLAIVSEAEFISMHIDQPLFGDVCDYLKKQGFLFHKFVTFGGRTLKPVIMYDNPNYCSQLMWADAMFIKDFPVLDNLSPDDLLKLGILAFIYVSPDLASYCFVLYDRKQNTEVNDMFLDLFKEQ